MRNDYEMITVNDYVNELDNVKCLSTSEVEIALQVERYILSQKRSKTENKWDSSLYSEQ